jgi:hypothetical protein
VQDVAGTKTLQDIIEAYSHSRDQAVLLNLSAMFHLLNTGRPLSALEGLGQLMKVSGHNLFKRMHWTTRAADELSDAIDAVLLETLQTTIQQKRFLSVTCDEVTAANGQSLMSVHVYYCHRWQRVHAFAGLPKIEGNQTAQVLLTVLVDALKGRLALTSSDLQHKLMQFACDGAAVLQGQYNGVGVRLQELCPFMLVVHCHAHRLDLVAESMDKQPVMQQATALALAPAAYFARSTVRVSALLQVYIACPAVNTCQVLLSTHAHIHPAFRFNGGWGQTSHWFLCVTLRCAL